MFLLCVLHICFFFKQKTAYEMRISDWSSDVCSSDLFVAALSTGYVWREGPWQVRAYARVDNLFDRQYAGSVIVNEASGRYFEPAPGRNWSTGLGATYTY